MLSKSYSSLFSPHMWYIECSKYLARSICTDQEKEAEQFICDLLDVLKVQMYENEDFEPLMIFGFIMDLYRFKERTNPQNISLKQFAEECFSLVIVHAKNADEDLILCSDFNAFLLDPRIYRPLNIFTEVKQIKYELLTGARKSSKIIPFLDTTSFVQHQENVDNWPKVALTQVIKRLEYEQLVKRDFTVKVDLNEFVCILNKLLNEMGDQLELCSDLVEFLKPYIIINERFDAFILSIYDYMKQFYSSESATVKKQKTCNICTLLCLVFWEPSELELLLPQVTQMPIHPLLNPDLFSICALLDEYTKTKSSYFSFFMYRPVHFHSAEVSLIVEQIRIGTLHSVASIVEQLNKIKLITQSDALNTIIQSIKIDYESDILEDTVKLVDVASNDVIIEISQDVNFS